MKRSQDLDPFLSGNSNLLDLSIWLDGPKGCHGAEKSSNSQELIMKNHLERSGAPRWFSTRPTKSCSSLHILFALGDLFSNKSHNATALEPCVPRDGVTDLAQWSQKLDYLEYPERFYFPGSLRAANILRLKQPRPHTGKFCRLFNNSRKISKVKFSPW